MVDYNPQPSLGLFSILGGTRFQNPPSIQTKSISRTTVCGGIEQGIKPPTLRGHGVPLAFGHQADGWLVA